MEEELIKNLMASVITQYNQIEDLQESLKFLTKAITVAFREHGFDFAKIMRQAESETGERLPKIEQEIKSPEEVRAFLNSVSLRGSTTGGYITPPKGRADGKNL